ncbi:MAG: acyltransferase [Anaeroplasmataceae bacterium]|nr:acyltransferase [Anaeroplasmataceae bacterium]
MRKSRKSKIKIGKKMCSLGPLYIDVLENADLEIGNNAFFNHNCNLTVRDQVKIGNDCLFGYNVVIIDHNHIMEPSKRGTYTKKPIIIGNNVWICANVVITAGVTIGDNAIIASGAVVTKDVEPNTMYGGGTARKIKDL